MRWSSSWHRSLSFLSRWKRSSSRACRRMTWARPSSSSSTLPPAEAAMIGGKAEEEVAAAAVEEGREEEGRWEGWTAREAAMASSICRRKANSRSDSAAVAAMSFRCWLETRMSRSSASLMSLCHVPSRLVRAKKRSRRACEESSAPYALHFCFCFGFVRALISTDRIERLESIDSSLSIYLVVD